MIWLINVQAEITSLLVYLWIKRSSEIYSVFGKYLELAVNSVLNKSKTRRLQDVLVNHFDSILVLI